MAIGRITGQMLSANLQRSGTDLAFETNLLVLDVTNSRVGIGTASPATTLHVSATDALRLPSGSTAQRPGSPANGDIRYNSDTGAVEGYAGGWLKMTGGTTLADADADTQIEVERTSDEDAIHIQTGGTDRAHIRSNGNIELNNLQIADATLSTLTTNGDLTLTPNGTGKVIVTDGITLQTNTADINGGAIDGTTIGANSAAAGTFTTVETTGNATIGGNLTVNGTTTTISTTNTTVSDNIFELNSGTSSNANDSGLLIERGSTGDNAFIGWDESADKFAMGTTTATAGDKSGGISVTTGTLVANIEGDVTGDVTGTVSDISNHLLDEDNMASDSATKAPSQQSVKAYVDAQDAAIASDTLTFTNKTIDANGTGNSITNIDSGNFLSGFFLDEDAMGSNSATSVASQQSIKAYVDAQDAAIASDTLTLTNKTFDANGTGNSLSNVEVADFAASAVVIESEGIGSNDNDTTIPTSAAVKDYVDTQLTASDLDFATDDSTALSIALGSETLQVSGGNNITTSGSGNTITVALDSSLTGLTSVQTNSISSADSTAVRIDDALNVDGALDVGGGFTISNGTSITAINDEDNMSSNSATALATQQSIKAYVDAEDANIASDTLTFTNKTFDANGTGNSISNIDFADFTSGVVLDEDNMASNSATNLATQQSIKAYVDTEVGNVSTTSISQGNSSATISDTGSDGAFTVVADGNTELVINDTSATFSGNVIMSGNLTVNGTTTTVNTTNTTVSDNILELNSGTSSSGNDAGIIIERGSTGDNAFIGWDESADKFTVGTTTATAGDKSGGISVTTGTLVANIEGDVTGDVTGTVSDISNHLLDEDNMATDSATKAPSQQSVKAYVDAQDAAIASDTLTFTNKTIDANGTGNSITNIDSGNFLSGFFLDEDNMASNDATAVASQQSIKAYVDAEDANIASDTLTLTNKTFDANGTGNSLSNVEVADFAASAVVIESEGIGSNDNDTTIPTSAAVKDYVDTQLTASDLDFATDDSTSLSIALGSESLQVSGGNNITTSGSGNTITIALDSSLTGLTSVQTNSISSADSTAVRIDDALNVDGALDVGAGLTLSNGTSVTAINDEDNMSSNSASALATQQSIKAYVDAEDANIASDTLTFTNKTFDANGTGNSLSNVEVADLAAGAVVTVSETLASNDSDSMLVTAGAIIDYVDAQDANIASDTLTFTNKTFDANATGNSISNIDFADFTSGVVADEDDMSSDSATKLATQQSIKAYVDTEVGNVSTTSISQGNSSATISDTGSDGALTVVCDGNTELVVNDTSATFSGNVIISGNMTVNGTTTTIDSTTLTVEDPLIQLAKNNSGGAANAFDQGLFFNRGSLDNVSFLWDESEDEFAFAVTSGEDGTTAGAVTIDSYANIKAGVAQFTDTETATVSAADGTLAMTLANSTGAVTFNAAPSFGDNNITNVGDVALDTISADGTTIGITLTDNTAAALDIKEASNSYLKFDTTNSSELITAGEAFTVASGKTFTTDTADINGGAIDGATIGAASAAAGTFTTATATSVNATNVRANDGTAAIVITDSTGAVAVSTAVSMTGNVDVNGGNFTFNEGSASVDARFESNGDTHALFIDGSEDHVGIRTSSPAYDLDVSGSTDALRLPNGTTAQRPTGAQGIIRFNTTTGKYEGCQDGSTYVEFAIAGDAPTFTKESTTGDGSTTTFTGFFSSAPESANNVFVYIDNVYQEPTENYTVSSTNITFTSAPHSGARIFAITGADNTALVTGGVARTETSAVSVSGSSAVTIMSFNASTYRSAELFVTVQDSGNTQYSVMKANVVHDGTTAYGNTYGIVNSAAGDITTLTFDHDGSSTINVKATALNSGTQSIKVQYSLSAA